MYDKTVRRRRAVLGLLVASSLILLTAYFGESAGGSLHAIQRGALEVVSPIQDVASRALKPVRDLVGWTGDTFRAKGDVKRLRSERDALREQAVANVAAARENQQLRGLLDLGRNAGIDDDGPVTARVIGQDPSLWYSQVQINAGTGDGVRADQPVVGPQGLVGVVSFAAPGYSVVRLITDHTTSVPARVNETGVAGVVQPEAGRPTDLVLNFTSSKDRVDPGQTIVTAGTTSKVRRLASIFPPDVPIGRVTRIENPGTDDQQVHLVPFVDLRRLEDVQVLTKPDTRP